LKNRVQYTTPAPRRRLSSECYFFDSFQRWIRLGCKLILPNFMAFLSGAERSTAMFSLDITDRVYVPRQHLHGAIKNT
jgi:hypothetical protein